MLDKSMTNCILFYDLPGSFFENANNSSFCCKVIALLELGINLEWHHRKQAIPMRKRDIVEVIVFSIDQRLDTERALNPLLDAWGNKLCVVFLVSCFFVQVLLTSNHNRIDLRG